MEEVVFYAGGRTGTWVQCNSFCPTSYPDAAMLCINNVTENAWIRTQFGTNYWIGYTDMPPYGGGKGTIQYGWITGCSSTYTNWNAGEPNNAGNNQDYAVVNQVTGKWDDNSPQERDVSCGCHYKLALTTTSVGPSSGPTYSPTTCNPFFCRRHF
jgi:hypothetical protein